MRLWVAGGRGEAMAGWRARVAIIPWRATAQLFLMSATSHCGALCLQEMLPAWSIW